MIHVFDASEGASGGASLASRMAHSFSPEGPFAKSPDFEYRPQQQRMAELVGRALDGSEPLVVEAATGVGKSLAYLLPAVTHALENGRKAIISTHTINLQEQLISKDIPIVKKVTGDFKAELIKGRGNYLCPTRLDRALKETGDLFTTSEAAELAMIAEWAAETKDGTLSDVDFSPTGKVWSMVCSEAHACTPRRCGPASGCFYQSARRRMAEAQVVIVNHTLFFTLLASAEDLLPEDGNFLFPRDFVILDEAHTIENIAARALGLQVSESSIRFELSRLFNPKTKKGFFPMMGEKQGVEEVMRAISESEVFFRNAEGACRFSDRGREFRVREPGLVEDTLSLPLQRVARIALKAGDAAKAENTRLELHDLAKRLTGVRAGVAAFLDQEDEDHVYWAERGGRDRQALTFRSAPVDVAPRLQEIFFQPGKCAVFTSATLGITDDPDLGYFRRRIGADEVEAACIESPFDFRTQMRLYLAKRMPEPRDAGYHEALREKIAHYLDLSNGRAFVLFTSYALMSAVADQLDEYCEDQGWRLLVQGREMPRHQMLAEFRRDTHSVLFGTDSFWTGVDVPGESLSNVIITRLPFAVPDHPVTASRIEHLEEQGLNAFTEYSVPEAILKLRQGVGRLIRSNKDEGICVILDNRIVTKAYGRAFLAALPDCPTEFVD